MKTSLSMGLSIGLLLSLSTVGCRSSASSTRRNEEERRNIVTSEGNDKSVTLSALEPEGAAGYDLAEKEEIRRKYKIVPDSTVTIRRINGPVTIESVDGETAEVLIVRSAKTRDELQYNRIVIEQTGDNLEIYRRTENRSVISTFIKMPEGRQRLVLRLPRQIRLDLKTINGNIVIGEVKGELEAHGINGNLRAGRVTGPTEIHDENGSVEIAFGPFLGRGIDISGINGKVTLTFEGEVNADLAVHDTNVNIECDLPGKLDRERGRLEGRLGIGGGSIEVHDVSGEVKLLKAAAGRANGTK